MGPCRRFLIPPNHLPVLFSISIHDIEADQEMTLNINNTYLPKLKTVSSDQTILRSSFFWTFPVRVLGKAATNFTLEGTLNLVILVRA